jgi:hypothetical protein
MSLVSGGLSLLYTHTHTPSLYPSHIYIYFDCFEWRVSYVSCPYILWLCVKQLSNELYFKTLLALLFHLFEHTQKHTHTSTHRSTSTHRRTHTHRRTNTHRRTHTHSEGHTLTHIHTYTHANTCIYTHNHTYTDARIFLFHKWSLSIPIAPLCTAPASYPFHSSSVVF